MPRSTLFPRTRPTLVFDGDCSFCSSAIRWLENSLPATAHAIPFQTADLETLGLSLQEAADMVWLVTKDSKGVLHQYGGYLAVSVLLRRQPSLGWRFLGILMDTPPFSPLANLGYRLVARFRHVLPGGTPACKVTNER